MHRNVKIVPITNLNHIWRPHVRPGPGNPIIFRLIKQSPPGIRPVHKIFALEDPLTGRCLIIDVFGFSDCGIWTILPPYRILVGNDTGVHR